ncbi:MAG: hypothetical protein N2745_11815 [Syntrophorhabdaceae bacterium]|nr:hypothetical protein [Syntrophorhabdaceae bacterium]
MKDIVATVSLGNGFDTFGEDMKFLNTTKKVDLRIRPHSFLKSALDEPDPRVDEIIKNSNKNNLEAEI